MGPSKPPWSAWKVLGVTLAVLVGILGLAVLGAIILLAVAMNSYGSNK
jgi:hypothetical protein